MREKVIVEEVERFKQNKIVKYLIDSHPNVDMNKLWIHCNNGLFTTEDLKEFYQLIGYSCSGYIEVFEDEEEKVYPK